MCRAGSANRFMNYGLGSRRPTVLKTDPSGSGSYLDIFENIVVNGWLQLA
jgi:hypothetical protein